MGRPITNIYANDAVRGIGPVDVTAQDGAKAVAMGLASQKSAETGQTVML